LLGTIFEIFFPAKYGNNIMSEVSCESIKTCDRNQLCFKTFLSTWLAFTTLLAPYTTDQIRPKLQASAQGAAKQCSGGSDGQHCGLQWYTSTWDGLGGLEVEMSNLGIFASNMVFFVSQTPVTSSTGGSSKSDPNAGLNEPSVNASTGANRLITTSDRAGAGILTVIFVTAWLGMVTWMIRGG
jgi:mannan endo-1,6-alpha-mannosidase